MDLFSSATLWAISLTLLLFFSLFYLSFELLIFISKSSFLSFGCFFITSCSFFSEDTNYMYIYSSTLCGSPVLCCFIFWFILVSFVGGFPTGLAILFKDDAVKSWLDALPAQVRSICWGGFSGIIHGAGCFIEGPPQVSIWRFLFLGDPSLFLPGE